MGKSQHAGNNRKMLGYRKRSFTRAHGLLEALRTNREDLDSLLALQRLIFGEILRTERKNRELRGNLKAVQGAHSPASQKRASYLKNRLEKVRQVAYVWRCFGDAIAFLYLDKFALKQVHFSTVNINPKQAAGFLSGKDGVASEIAFLEDVLARKVPALLCDLTNTIRHGDVCLMAGPDPRLIEVKASKSLDRRGRRQLRELQQIQEFLETDRSKTLRGLGEVRRAASKTEQVNYLDELNDCIDEAMRKGHCIKQPETGLYYLAMAEGAPSVPELMAKLSFASPWLFSLNALKNDQTWAPYSPFVLSIRKHDPLWAFIRGDVFLIVLFDLARVQQIASDAGALVVFDKNNDDHPFTVNIPGVDGAVGISKALLARIGIEFVSPDWLVRSSIEMIEQGANLFPEEEAADPSNPSESTA
jgi:hypothetical protein